MNTEGPLALLWVGIGLGCFYVALIWINTLLPVFLTPLFIIPVTWVLERFGIPRQREDASSTTASGRSR